MKNALEYELSDVSCYKIKNNRLLQTSVPPYKLLIILLFDLLCENIFCGHNRSRRKHLHCTGYENGHVTDTPNAALR